jgi:hypothetical protein
VTLQHARSLPQNGDIVVERETRSPARWSLRQLPASAQFSCASRDEAIGAARKFAREQEVDLWEREGQACTLLETFRVTEGRP